VQKRLRWMELIFAQVTESRVSRSSILCAISNSYGANTLVGHHALGPRPREPAGHEIAAPPRSAPEISAAGDVL
jgi:uncharacterized protein (DUF1810 family)